MKKIKSIRSPYFQGYGKYFKNAWFAGEFELDIDEALAMRKNSTAYKCVKELVDAGATRVTVSRGFHPENKRVHCDIYNGYTDFKI